MKMVLTLFIVIVDIINFAIKFMYLNGQESNYVSTDVSVYKDSFTAAYYFNEIYFIESLIFEAVSLKILDILILNDNIKLFFESIHFGVTSFFKYLSYVIFVYVFYSTISYILYGPFVVGFGTYQGSLNNMLLISFGFYNINQIINSTAGWGTFYLLSFFLFLIFSVFIVFIALFAESFKYVVCRFGYPEDYEYSNWKLKDYIVWLCHCVGNSKDKKKN